MSKRKEKQIINSFYRFFFIIYNKDKIQTTYNSRLHTSTAYFTILYSDIFFTFTDEWNIRHTKQITTSPTKGWCNYFFSFLSFLKIIFTHIINHKQKYKTRHDNSATDNFTCSRNRKVDKITSLAFFDFLKDVFLGLCWNMKKNVFTLYQADNFTNSFYWRPIFFSWFNWKISQSQISQYSNTALS